MKYQNIGRGLTVLITTASLSVGAVSPELSSSDLEIRVHGDGEGFVRSMLKAAASRANLTCVDYSDTVGVIVKTLVPARVVCTNYEKTVSVDASPIGNPPSMVVINGYSNSFTREVVEQVIREVVLAAKTRSDVEVVLVNGTTVSRDP